MGNKEPKKKLVGPWRSLHIAVWLIGLFILAINDWWWPGILVLVAISVLLEGLLQRFAPQAYEEETPSVPAPTPAVAAPPPAPPVAPPVAVSATPAVQEHRAELLPQSCPNCSGPIRGHEVRWTSPNSANCPYCGTNLPMSKA
jgi:hypothetical protein